MPTFVEEIQSVARSDDAELRRRLSDRIESVGDAVDVLEEWTEASRETHAELSSKYETAERMARDDVREATDEETAEALPTADLVAHPAVSDRTKRHLGEYATKLSAFEDEERSYEGARGELLAALGAELALYERLLGDLGAGETTVRDAQREIAQFAREETPGGPGVTATDAVLESTADGESGSK
jgi:hypothetical protein